MEYYVVVVAALGQTLEILARLVAVSSILFLECHGLTNLRRVVIIELYDNGALFHNSVDGHMTGRRAANHGGIKSHIGGHIVY